MHSILSLLPGALFVGWMAQPGTDGTSPQTEEKMISLPAPKTDSRFSVERSLQIRRSVRSFKNEPLPLSILSQLAWAAQGVTQKSDAPPGWSWGPWQGGRRTAPSAGALYPLETYVVAGNIAGLEPGIYKYKPQNHQLALVMSGDHRAALAKAASGQEWMTNAPCIFVVGAVYARTETKYGRRAERYVHIEVGHAVENICLQAAALELGTTMVGAFGDADVKEVLGMPKDEDPLAIVPVGKPAS